MRIVALAGGIGGARFLRGVLRAAPQAEVTVIGNTGDDLTLHGLRICPDLDTVMYTLGGGINEEQGWGRSGETYAVQAELAEYRLGPAWFHLGDRDLATHLVRTQMLAAGYALSDVTAALCDRWQPRVRLLPMSDDRVETHVVISDAEGRRAVHFQEWWLAMRAAVPAERFVSVGAETAKPAPGVIEALAAADVVLLPPSNPVVSIGSILSVPGIRDALSTARRTGGGRLTDHRGGAGAGHGRRVPAGHRGPDQRRGRRPTLWSPQAQRRRQRQPDSGTPGQRPGQRPDSGPTAARTTPACWTAGSSTPPTTWRLGRRPCPGSRCGRAH